MSEEKLGKSILGVYILSYIAAPLSYLMRIIFSRTLSLEDFGLFFSLVGFFTLLAVFQAFGTHETLNYYMTKYYAVKDYARAKGIFYSTWIFRAGMSLIFTLGIIICAPYLGKHYFQSENAVISLYFFAEYFLFFSFAQLYSQVFVSDQKPIYNAWLHLLRSAVVLAAFGVLFFIMPAYLAVLISWSAMALLLFLLFYGLYRKSYSRFYKTKPVITKSLLKEWLNYSFLAILGGSAAVFISGVDLQFLTFFRSLDEVALYTNAYAIAGLLVVLITPIGSVLFPLVANNAAKNMFSQLAHKVRLIYEGALFLFLPFLLVLLIFGSEILDFLFGSAYAAAGDVLLILSLGLFFSAFAQIHVSIILGLGYAKLRSYLFWLVAIINIVGNAALIRYGAIGISLATAVSFFVLYVGSLWLTLRQIKLEFRIRFLARIVLLNVACFFVLYFLKETITLPAILKFGVVAVIMVPFYLVIGYLLKIYDINSIKELKKLI